MQLGKEVRIPGGTGKRTHHGFMIKRDRITARCFNDVCECRQSHVAKTPATKEVAHV